MKNKPLKKEYEMIEKLRKAIDLRDDLMRNEVINIIDQRLKEIVDEIK